MWPKEKHVFLMFQSYLYSITCWKCCEYVYCGYHITSSSRNACGHQLMLQQWHQRELHVPIGYFVAPIRKGGLSGFSESFDGAFGWSNSSAGAHGGQPLHHILFSGIVLPKNNATLALDFLEFPHPSSLQAIKLQNVPSKGTACPLDQSIQWMGRRGTRHLYAIIQAISICTVKGEEEVWC